MNAVMVTRNIVIAGRRTTVRLEAAVWDAFDDICMAEDVSRHELCSRIELARDGANRAQAVRATVINYYRLAAGTILSPTAKRVDVALRGVGRIPS